MNENYQKLIHDTIKTITNQFHRKPHNFFNEHEFHQYCYHVFYRKKEFSKQYQTSDGFKTNILHPEYPTLQRFNRKNIALDPNGVRARYDMALLNPEFIVNNPFEKVRCRDIRLFRYPSDFQSKNLMAAIEFKYIIKHGPQFLHEIQYDFFKLQKAEEVEWKYLLVFANTKENQIDYFDSLEDDTTINKIIVRVTKENGKKHKEIEQHPPHWLDV